MDRQAVERHLALAESHMAAGQRHTEEQRSILAELERDGHDTTTAGRLLAMIEATSNCPSRTAIS